MQGEESTMPDMLTGWVHGNTIRLDSPVPPLEGRRVLVRIEPAEDPETTLTPDVQARHWQSWVERGPQGPIEDDGDPELP
jgi:hypothetical protein